MALWQNERQLNVIDQDGRVLAEDGLAAYAGLPMIVGPHAPEHASEFLALVAARRGIADRAEAAVRVSGGRWDRPLWNGVETRPPEAGVAGAVHRLTGPADPSGGRGCVCRDRTW